MTRFRPSYAAVAATVALFIAIGGTATAALVVTSSNIKDDTILSRDIKTGTVTGSDVANGGLTGTDVRDGTIAAVDIKAGTIKASNLDSAAVGSEAVQDGSLTVDDLAPGTIPADTGLDAGEEAAAGMTQTGVFGAYHADGNVDGVRGLSTDISFPHPLATRVTPSVVVVDGSPTASCPGSPTNPTAEPGYLCLYFTTLYERLALIQVFDPSNTGGAFPMTMFDMRGDDAGSVEVTIGDGKISRFGASIWAASGAESSPTGNTFGYLGTWAVTPE